MTDIANLLYVQTLEATIAVAMPIVVVVGCVGVLTSLAQTLVGIQDQNLSFGPKLAAVAAMLAVGAAPALTMLVRLLETAIAALPHLAS
jgi:flagellar biosynthesis protein FliQ